MPTCFKFFVQHIRRAASRALWTAGRRPMRMAMMAMTTSHSMSVKPRRRIEHLSRRGQSRPVMKNQRFVIPRGRRLFKERIRSAQHRAVLAVNRELVLFYWQIGRDILARQRNEGLGARVIEGSQAT